MRLVSISLIIILIQLRPGSSLVGPVVVAPLSSSYSLDRRSVSLAAASSKKNLSAAAQERYDEERRRQERAQDVVIGKTSALRDAKDYALNVQATEQEWMRQASDVEQEIFRCTEKGMNALKMLKVKTAAEAFDRVFELRPSAYLWQAGIAKFYMNELEEAADIFARSASVYESKFGEPASEERIWRNACELKLLNSLDKKERKRVENNGGVDLPTIPENDHTAELLASESRKVIRITRDLFDATLRNDHSTNILSRAKLRSVCGKPGLDIKMWRLNSWFYLGLYYDALGDEEESKACMKMALRMCPSAGNGSDIIHTLPMLHMSQRDWFDDDTFEDDDDASFDIHVGSSGASESSRRSKSHGSLIDEKQEADPWVTRTVRDGVSKLKMRELRQALRVRGLKGNGSKEELQERLFTSLMHDAGLST